jgi:hypothetical protein
MISKFPSWPHALSGYYKIPLRNATALLDIGLLPSAGDASAIDQPTAIDMNDDDAIDVLESARPRFDTPVELFIDSLHFIGANLVSNEPEWPHEGSLVEFRCFSYGRIDRAYPVARHWMPWRQHRVAVTRAELIAAGYPALRAMWGRAGEDPFASVPIGGEIPLGHPGWVASGFPRPNLNIPRGRFLLRLAEVLEARK